MQLGCIEFRRFIRLVLHILEERRHNLTFGGGFSRAYTGGQEGTVPPSRLMWRDGGRRRCYLT